MARRRSRTVEEKVEVEILPEKAPEGVPLVVVEWNPLEDGDDLDGKLQEAVESLGVGGALYFTLPRGMDGEEIVGKLRGLFSSIGPLNIGTKPGSRTTTRAPGPATYASNDAGCAERAVPHLLHLPVPHYAEVGRRQENRPDRLV
jgi:hypothetical protein